MNGFAKPICETQLIRPVCGAVELFEGMNGLLAILIALAICSIAYMYVYKNIDKIYDHYKVLLIIGILFIFVSVLSYVVLGIFIGTTGTKSTKEEIFLTGSGLVTTEARFAAPNRSADACTTSSTPGEPALSPYSKARICYEKEGCAATEVLCRAFGASATGGLPCASRAAAAFDPNGVLSVADLAESRSCTVDALAWLAGAPASVRADARNRAINLIANTCDKGGFGADQPIAEKIATSLNIATPCKR